MDRDSTCHAQYTSIRSLAALVSDSSLSVSLAAAGEEVPAVVAHGFLPDRRRAPELTPKLTPRLIASP